MLSVVTRLPNWSSILTVTAGADRHARAVVLLGCTPKARLFGGGRVDREAVGGGAGQAAGAALAQRVVAGGVEDQVAERGHAVADVDRRRAARAVKPPGPLARCHGHLVGVVVADEVAEAVVDLHRHRRADGHARPWCCSAALPKTIGSAPPGLTVKLLEAGPVMLPVPFSPSV